MLKCAKTVYRMTNENYKYAQLCEWLGERRTVMRITEKVDYGKLSFEELKALAEMGAPKAQNELGFRYAFGTGIKRDAEKSIEW